MAVSLKHTTQAVGTDAGNGEIRKAQWNEEHTLTAAANTLLGAVTAGAVGEITCTAAGRALLDDADAAAQRTTLGIGESGSTAGQVLTSNGPSSTPTWQTAGSFPSGTALLFQQTAAPTGWTKVTTHNDKALRVVSGTVGSGGTLAFTSAFASRSISGTVGQTTLTTTQMPSHNHTFNAMPFLNLYHGNGTSRPGELTASTITTSSTGGGGSHNHSFTGTNLDMAVQYVDVIIATKD